MLIFAVPSLSLRSGVFKWARSFAALIRYVLQSKGPFGERLHEPCGRNRSYVHQGSPNVSLGCLYPKPKPGCLLPAWVRTPHTLQQRMITPHLLHDKQSPTTVKGVTELQFVPYLT